MTAIFSKGCSRKCANIDIEGKEFKRRRHILESIMHHITKAKQQNKGKPYFELFVSTCMGYQYTCNAQLLHKINIVKKKEAKLPLGFIRYNYDEKLSEGKKESLVQSYRTDMSYGQDMTHEKYLNLDNNCYHYKKSLKQVGGGPKDEIQVPVNKRIVVRIPQSDGSFQDLSGLTLDNNIVRLDNQEFIDLD